MSDLDVRIKDLEVIGVLEAKNERLRSALERLLHNSQLIFNKRPVRDWGETLAEAKAALHE